MSRGRNRWVYPLVYVGFFLISMLPLYTEKPYLPRDTQNVLVSLFSIVTLPYRKAGIVFHLLTLLMTILIIWKPKSMGRVAAAYIGLNYLLLSIVQTRGVTQEYGLVVHIGGMAMYSILGVVWIVVSIKGDLEIDPDSLQLNRLGFAPLALLAFWAPYALRGNTIVPNFDPMLLLLSPDYGLTYCLTTPVFLLLLIVVYPKVNPFAYRITAFNGLLYGVFNLTHWLKPESRWMGFLHVPLLVLSAVALLLPIMKKQSDKPLKHKAAAPSG